MLMPLLVVILLFALAILAVLLDRRYFGGKKRSIIIDGINRTYKVHLPESYSGNKKYALVLVLHGLSDSPNLIELNSAFSKKADKENFIAVYPKGTGKKLSWNAKFCCGDSLRNNVNDIKFLDEVIKTVGKDFAVDKERVFVVGFSNGGMMAYSLASELSHVKGIGVVAGTIGSKTTKIPMPKGDVSVIAIHGERDQSVPLAGGGKFSFLSVDDSLSTWAPEAEKLEEKGDYFIKTTYKKTGKENIVLYTVKNRTHVWFGGLQDYILNQKIPKVFATDLIWDFFKKLK